MTRRAIATRAVLSTACLGAVVALGSTTLATFAHAQESGGEEPFIVFDRLHPLLPDDGEPMVEVFESGRAVVTRGPERTRPGRYEIEVGADEIARLKALAASGASADVPGRAEPRREIVDGREVFTIVHDAVTTTVRMRVSATDGGIALAGVSAAPRTVELEVEGLAELADAPVRGVGTDALIELESELLDVFAEPLGGEAGR